MEPQAKFIDTFQIVGFTLSAIISIILILAGQDQIASATLGFVLAVFIQLFDLQIRHANTEERLLKANILSKNLYKDEWLLQRVRQIVDDYYAVKGQWFDFFKLRAGSALTECHHVVHSLADGDMVVPLRSSFTFAFEGIKYARSSIKGVTTDWEWWRNPRAEKFLQENVNAIQRGVAFSRIFILSRGRLEEFQDILQKHQSKGVDVYVAFTDDLPKEYNEGFTLMDDKVVVLRERISDGVSRERCISIKPVEVERMIKRHEKLMQYSYKVGKVGDLLS